MSHNRNHRDSVAGDQADVPCDDVCPITRQPMLHPVRTSDKKCYELEAIHGWVTVARNNTSPLTREPLTHVARDRVLEQEISKRNPSDRYDGYVMSNGSVMDDEAINRMVGSINAELTRQPAFNWSSFFHRRDVRFALDNLVPVMMFALGFYMAGVALEISSECSAEANSRMHRSVMVDNAMSGLLVTGSAFFMALSSYAIMCNMLGLLREVSGLDLEPRNEFML